MGSPGDLYIDDHHHDDGDPTFVNDIEPEYITCRYLGQTDDDEVIVWQRATDPDCTPPGAIVNFNASTDRVGEIRFTWSNASGDPTPTYDLYRNGTLLQSNVSSGVIISMAAGTYTFFVRAKNSCGETDSNLNSGTSNSQPVDPPPSGSQTYTTPGNHTFTVPSRVTSITIHFVGAGGGGGAAKQSYSGQNPEGGGGYAGQEFTKTYSVSPGQQLVLTVGAGGKGVGIPNGSHANGNAGSPTGMGSEVAQGGAGGIGSVYGGVSGYRGNGGGRDGARSVDSTPIWGTYTGWGGQGSSVGNGGAGRAGPGDAGKGTQGGGGGGSASWNSTAANSNDGGDGYIRISWG